MGLWNEEVWSALCSGEACPICRRGEPLDMLVPLEASWVTMAERAPVRGYVCLVSQTHVVELHDLQEEVGSAYAKGLPGRRGSDQGREDELRDSGELHPAFAHALFPSVPGRPV